MASYRVTEIRATLVKGKIDRVDWRGEFVDSDGGSHWSSVWYRLTPESEHSPEAAALLAAATSSKDIAMAVDADARRCLADLEDPMSPAGSRPMATAETISIDPQVQ